MKIVSSKLLLGALLFATAVNAFAIETTDVIGVWASLTLQQFPLRDPVTKTQAVSAGLDSSQ